jgi:multicomponent Na+:H+ antiporter subunit A
VLAALLAALVAAALAPLLERRLGRRAAPLLALVPAALFASFVRHVPEISAGGMRTDSLAWIAELGVSLSFRLDGLSLLMALVVTGVGAVVLLYAGSYMEGHPRRGNLLGYLLAFLAAMLGLVLSDNLLGLFVFWEATSLLSYVLIGFEREKAEVRASALQALLVTGGGGLALLAGFVLLGQAGGSLDLGTLAANAEAVKASPHYLPALLLVLLGAFTKSAQVPFHFWLPEAMAAPAPVSTFLHSATMVKAGVFLLARLHPTLGGTPEWTGIVTTVGAATMLTGALLAVGQRDLKRLLAYSTVSALGSLVMLVGVGTPAALAAAMVLLLAHALYKGALFLVAGTVDHETGTRDVASLGGLFRALPATGVAAAAAAFSMAGLPPLLGFVSKELLYDAALRASPAPLLLVPVAVGSNMLLVAVALSVGWGPFSGGKGETPKAPHEAPVAMWSGPLLLGLGSLAAGLFSGAISPFVSAAAAAAIGAPHALELELWHGFNLVLAKSLVTLVVGVALFAARRRLRTLAGRLAPLVAFGPLRIYRAGLAGLVGLAKGTASVLSSGSLRQDLRIVLAATVVLVAPLLLTRAVLGAPDALRSVRPLEAVLALLVVAGAAATVLAGSRLAAVVALGVTGFGVALLFLVFGAPDLAMTQFAVETLSVLLFVAVLRRLPRLQSRSAPRARAVDALLAGSVGAVMAGLVLAVHAEPLRSRLAPFFRESSLVLAKGRNVVNVILVDFRGLDTLGEITVLGVAALGVWSLVRLRLSSRGAGAKGDRS